MSSRRGVTIEQQETFLEKHEELQRFGTSLSVEQDDETEEFRIVAEDNNGEEVFLQQDDILEIPEVVTYVEEAIAPPVRLYAALGQPWDSDEGSKYYDGVIVLTEDGFGVTDEDSFIETQDNDEEPVDTTLSDGETLLLDLYSLYFDSLLINSEDPLWFIENFGGVSLTIEYEVIGGTGSTIIGAFDINREDETILFEESAAHGARGRGGPDEGVLMFEMTEGDTFEAIGFSTTGSLEVVVTGINFVTNIDATDFFT